MAAEPHLATLEQGELYFFYRPKVEREAPAGLDDVQRLYMVLHPRGQEKYRLLVVPKKRLPTPNGGGSARNWAFVDAVAGKPDDMRAALGAETYETKTRGTRHLPAARPAGEGVYRLLRHGDHTHLVYALEKPEDLGDVQRALGLEREASLIATVKNPDKPAPKRAAVPAAEEVDFPARLKNRFGDRRFIALDPPDFLDHQGAELVLVGASEEPSEELGISLDAEQESRAELFRDLEMDRRQWHGAPLLGGGWA